MKQPLRKNWRSSGVETRNGKTMGKQDVFSRTLALIQLHGFVKGNKGLITNGDLGKFYSEHPELKAVMKPSSSSSAKDFIRRYGVEFGIVWLSANDKTKFDRITIPQLSVLRFLYDLKHFVEQAGGQIHSGAMARFFDSYPEHRTAYTGSLRRFLEEYGPSMQLKTTMNGSALLITLTPTNEPSTKDAAEDQKITTTLLSPSDDDVFWW